jgi:FKBP-type peptidyl-prolyl cis-trans isomerase 2
MKKGDFVKVSYSGWVEGQLIETTDMTLAKKEGVFDDRRKYEPAVVIVGEGHVLPGLDVAMETMKVSENKKLELKAVEAFGERSFRFIQLVPLRDFRKQKLNPMPGMMLEIEGRPAKIQSVSGGRVRVDFNHPLAGKDVQYEIKVEADAKTEAQKIEFLLERAFKEKGLKFTVSGTKDKTIVLDVPDAVKANQIYQIMQIIFKTEVEKYLGIKKVEYKGDKKVEKKPAKK